MEQLYETIKQRCECVKQVTENEVTPERFKGLREEEKGRCEKENFVVAMLRSINKTTYYRLSYEAMRRINPTFSHEMNLERTEENFLNDFVGLYRHFFFTYEEMFNFKLKLQTLIRPTNHSIVTDLVKYLVDFSRDYYQQTLFWYMKSLCRPSRPEPVQQSVPSSLASTKEVRKTEEAAEESPSKSNKRQRVSLNQISLTRPVVRKEEDNLPSLASTNKNPIKNYQILEVGPFPILTSQQKDSSTNVEVLKIRINEIYRDMKARNSFTRSTLTNYWTWYFGDKDKGTTQPSEDHAINRVTFPFRMTVSIQRNGFSFINVTYNDPRYNKKDKGLSPVKASTRQRQSFVYSEPRPKPQFTLNSLRVLRISDSFLPPLHNQSTTNDSTLSSKKTTTPNDMRKTRPKILSCNPIKEEEDRQKQLVVQKMPQKSEASEPTKIDSVPRLGKEKVMKERSIRKLQDLKRSFKSEEKGVVQVSSDPEKKIFDWLEKLRHVKELERRKIMGLNYL